MRRGGRRAPSLPGLHALEGIEHPIAPADPIGGNFQSALHTIDCMRQVDGTTELKGNEIANDAGSIARSRRSAYGRTTDLLPFDRQPIMRPVLPPPPTDRHTALWLGECAIFDGIGGQLV